MRLVVDANVILSALIRSQGLTRKIFSDLRLELFAPAYLLTELTEQAAYAREKSGLPPKEFESAVKTLWSRVTFVSDQELTPFLTPASALIKDSGDWLYLACALSRDAEVWSDDKGFKEQTRVNSWNTTELARHLGYLD